jgi:hypothetical protein
MIEITTRRVIGLTIVVAIGGIIWLAPAEPPSTQKSGSSPEATEAVSPPRIEMTEQQRAAFLGMTADQARSYITADSESCPLVTTGSLQHFPDSGEPVWVIACTDGSRYYVFWRGDIGRVKALSF